MPAKIGTFTSEHYTISTLFEKKKYEVLQIVRAYRQCVQSYELSLRTPKAQHKLLTLFIHSEVLKSE